MRPLWAGYDFADCDLNFWATELAAAAIDVLAERRDAFLSIVCDGSPRLLEEVRSLLSNMWADEAGSPFRGCYEPGDTVRDCIILRPIGRGGMGEVYRAVQRSLRRLVAVKVVTEANAGMSALALEATNTARLLHPNIVAVYDAETGTDRTCIVMELVDGVSLRTWIERHWQERQTPPSPETVRSIVRQVASGLAHAHAQGLVHLDVKPENVLLTRRDDEYVAKVADFGIARRRETPAGVVMGTPGYIAPEQMNHAAPDPREDLFALGVVIYELTTGKQPFAGRSPAETYYNTLTIEPSFPDDPSWAPIVATARRALQKAPERRYQTADALIADLDRPMERDGPTLNPLLTELPVSVQRWWSQSSSGATLAFASLLWGSSSLAISMALGAACVRVLWASSGTPASYEMIFGYAVEPNAGPWYVVGTSMCFLIGCAFLEAAHRGLQRTHTLKSTDGQSDPLARVAAVNRAVFKHVTPSLIALAIGFVAIPELAFRSDHAFGWVQADFAGRFVGTSYQSLRNDGKIGELPAVQSLCAGCSVAVAAVANGRSGFTAPRPTWFAMFLGVALSHQIVLTAFGMWIGAKVVFFFWLLSTALLGGAQHGLRLTPDFQDTDDYRFGLGRLDNVYYAILWLVVAGSFGLSLQAIANVSKGTYFLAGDPVPALFGQAVSLLGIVTLLFVVLLIPVGVFLFLNIKAIDQENGRLAALRRNLEGQLQTAPLDRDHDRLRAELREISTRRAVVSKQSLLPLRQPSFVALLTLAVMLLLLLPLSVHWFGASAGVGPGPITNGVCAVSGNPNRLR